MRANPKRQANTHANRQTTDQPTGASSRHKARVSQRTQSAAVQSVWGRQNWPTRADTENQEDLAHPSGELNISYSSPPAMKITDLVTDKNRRAFLPPRTTKDQPPLLNFGNDYSDVFVHRGILPQNWVQNSKNVFQGYPKLQRLHELKRVQFERHAPPAVCVRRPEHEIHNSLRNMIDQQMQFDVIMIHGCVEAMAFDNLVNLPIDELASRPSLLYLWVPATRIAEGREVMEKWGYRKGEDITYIVSSFGSRHAPTVDSWHTETLVFRPSTWHCLMGLRGTMRRSTNTELIHCNVDTDVIFESPEQRASIVPEEIYSLIENFTSMSRKIHILPTASTSDLPVRPRQGWVILSPDVFSVGSLNPAKYRDKGTIPVSREIDLLRPQTPPTSR